MKNRNRQNFIFGIIAGTVAIAVAAAFRIFVGGIFLPELASQTVFSLTPGQTESSSVETFGSLAKYSVFTIAIITNLALYGSLAEFLDKIYIRLADRGFVVNLLQLSFIPYFIMAIIAAIFLQLNELLTGSSEIQFALLFLLLPNVVFGRTLIYLFQRENNTTKSAQLPTEPSGIINRHKPVLRTTTTNSSQAAPKISRRQFIIMSASAVVVVLFLWARGFLSFFNSQQQPSETDTSTYSPHPLNFRAGSIFAEQALAPFIASEVTPNEKFYRVDTNIITPSVDVNSWRLEVLGLIKNGPMQLTYDQIKAMPSMSEYATLECISDKIDGDLISTAYWKGVSLKSILEKAQVLPQATYIVFRCVDGYDVGIPLDRGLMYGTILAYEMNGAPLPGEHGFPIRAIVPGLYGMMNAKWIKEIELVDRIYQGFWQRRGWANNAKYQTHSKIVFPGDALRSRFLEMSANVAPTVGNKSPIAGIAFAGDRGISKVEVSTDGGNTWQTANIKDPLSSNSWVLWALDWIPRNKGKYNIVVRATDKAGNLQTAEVRDNYPNGATGYHLIIENA